MRWTLVTVLVVETASKKRAWFTRVCRWVTVRLICFRARAQRSGTRNRERREADYEYDYEYECDSYVESCHPELNRVKKKPSTSAASLSTSTIRGVTSLDDAERKITHISAHISFSQSVAYHGRKRKGPGLGKSLNTGRR